MVRFLGNIAIFFYERSLISFIGPVNFDNDLTIDSLQIGNHLIPNNYSFYWTKDDNVKIGSHIVFNEVKSKGIFVLEKVLRLSLFLVVLFILYGFLYYIMFPGYFKSLTEEFLIYLEWLIIKIYL